MEALRQSKDQNMTKSTCDDRCPVCKGTGIESVQAMELMDIDREKYRETIELHIATYGTINFPTNGYGIPCRRCNGGHSQRVKVARERANIPSSFYNSYIEDFKTDVYMDSKGEKIDITKTINAVKDFIGNFDKWDKEGLGLYIYSGMKGSGKTFLASCICNSLLRKYPVGTRFVSASNLLNLSKQSDSSGNYENDPISLLCNCKCLVLDDLGQKNCGSEWLNDVLFQIIDSRYQKGLVTIYTSNVKISNLELDDRVVDRINKTSFQLCLPEYCVRAREANEKKLEFLKARGLL